MPNWLFVILSEHPNLNAKGFLISVNFPYWAGGEPKCCPLSLLCSLFCCLRRVGGTRLVPTGLGLPYKLFIFAYACQQPRAYHSFYSALVLSLANVRHKGKRVASALRRSSSWQKSCGDMLNKRVRDSSETTNTPTTSVDSFRASHSDTPNLCVWIRSFNSPVAQALQQNLVPETSYISHVKGKTVHAGSRTSTFNNSVSLWRVHFVSCTTLSICQFDSVRQGACWSLCHSQGVAANAAPAKHRGASKTAVGHNGISPCLCRASLATSEDCIKP